MNRFKIGQKFIPLGRKNKTVWIVSDIHTTRNLNGEIVKVRYVATHEFRGQIITDYDVCDATIARGLLDAEVLKVA